jgi:hypothetical protein
MPPPNYPPPQNEAGALLSPRQLNRWLDVNPQGGRLSRTRGFITMPAFGYSNAAQWKGYSDIIVAFNYEGPNNFSLKPFVRAVTPVYTLCVMWVDENMETHRYSLWRAANDVIFFPLEMYDGQLIGKNFRFEIWSTPVSAFSTVAMSFLTSVLGSFDYRYQDDFALVNADPEVTNFSAQGTGSAITMDNTVITMDDTNITMDETGQGSFTLPLVFPDDASPEPNLGLIPPQMAYQPDAESTL